jgi:cyclohexanone monooxygenase
MTEHFPNMFMYNGPQSPCAFYSPFVLVDQTSRHILKVVDLMQDSGALTVEPSAAAQQRWCNHVNGLAEGTVLADGDGWWMSANIPGKTRQVIAYLGSFADYSDRCDAAIESFAEDFEMDARAAQGQPA